MRMNMGRAGGLKIGLTSWTILFVAFMSTTIFLGLCAVVVASIYVLLQRYRQSRNYNSFSSRAKSIPRIESTRALSSGIDTSQSWTWRAESELSTVDLVHMREGRINDDGAVSQMAVSPRDDIDSDEGHKVDHDLENRNSATQKCPRTILHADKRSLQ